jgi:multiple sugar transport system substrate-binding protein
MSDKKMSRRKFLTVAGAAAAVVVGGAAIYLSSSPTTTPVVSPTTTQAATQTTAAAGGQVNFAYPTADEITGLVNHVTPQFSAAAPGWSINPIQIPFENLHERLMTAFIGKVGAYDLFYLDYPWTGEFYGGGYARELTPYLQDPNVVDPNFDLSDIVPNLMKALGTYKGKTYGIPFDGAAMFEFYRTDLFNDETEKKNFESKYGHELKPPETWDEFNQVAEFFTRPPNLYGTCLFLKQDPNLECMFLNRLATMGSVTGYLDDQMKPTLNTNEALEALNLVIKQMKYCPPDVLSYSWGEVITAISGGIIATAEDFMNPFPMFNDPSASKIAGNVGSYPIPRGQNGQYHNCMGGTALAISADSKNPLAAFKLMQVLKNKENDKWGLENAIPGTRTSTYADPELLQTYGYFLPTQLDATNTAVTRPNIPELEQLMIPFRANVGQACAGKKSPEQALGDTTSQWNTILHGAGYF